MCNTGSAFCLLHEVPNVQEPFLGVHSINTGDLHGAEDNSWFKSSFLGIGAYLVHTYSESSGLVSSESNLGHSNCSCSMMQRNAKCWQLEDLLQKYSPASSIRDTVNPPMTQCWAWSFLPPRPWGWSCHRVGCHGTGGREGTLLRVQHHTEV